jgi:hypothetical protein
MIRRATYAFAMTVALLGALVLPTAQPASAGTYQCSVVMAPSVAIDRPYTLITGTLAPNCEASHSTWASWKIRNFAYGQNGLLEFYHPTLDYTNPYSNSDSIGFSTGDPYGTYYAYPSSAYDNNDQPLTQNTVSYVVKARSLVYLSAARARSYVTLHAYNVYYNGDADAYRAWWGHTVSFQYKRCSTCSWTYLRNVNTDSNGVATFRFVASHTLYYRALTDGNTSAWGATSGVIVR